MSSASYADPMNLVNRYVELDYAGARLSSDTYGNISSLSAWEKEPGWDSAVIVSDYSLEVTPDGVAVTYIEHGYCPGGMNDIATENTVIFKLADTIDESVITEPLIEPHVSAELMCEKFKQCCISSM